MVIRVLGRYLNGCLGADVDAQMVAVDVSEQGPNGKRQIKLPTHTVRLQLERQDHLEFRDSFPGEKIDLDGEGVWWDTNLGWVDSFGHPVGPPRLIVPIITGPSGHE